MAETDTEDPNIATLRACLAKFENYFEVWGANHETESCPEDDTCACPLVADVNWAFSSGREAISALASTLVELRERLNGRSPDAVEAPPAPAPGELAEQHEKLWTLIRALRAEHAGDLRVADNIRRIVDPLFENTAKWQRLQWRPASEAPRGARVLFMGQHQGLHRFVCIGERHESRDVWVDEGTCWGLNIEWQDSEVLGFIPLDALPALNGGDDNG